MRRITKIGSVLLAVMVIVPALSLFDLFDGAKAADAAPLVYRTTTDDAVRYVAYANGPVDPSVPLATQRYVYAYVEATPLGDALVVRDRDENGPVYLRSGVEDAPYFANVSGIAISHDGRSLVLGTYDGLIHYFTSASELYDSSARFDTKSHVTDIDIDQSGRFIAAVTYHGDVYFFERGQFLGARLPYFHHNPLALFRVINPDRLPQNLLDSIPESIGVDENLSVPLTTRIYSDVAIGGRATGSDPAGLGVVAATTDGQLFAFNVAAFRPTIVPGVGAVTDLDSDPAAYRLSEAACQEREVQGIQYTLPCDATALAALIDDVDGLSSGAAHEVLKVVSDAIRSQVVLDPVLGLLGRDGAQVPITDLEATQGRAARAEHMFIAADSSGTIHGFRTNFTAGAIQSIQKVWRTDRIGTLTDVDMSGLFPGPTDWGLARIAAGTSDGRVVLFAAVPVSIGKLAPAGSHVTDAPVLQVAVSDGDASGGSGAGDHIAFLTDSGRIGMLHGVQKAPDGSPLHIYDGFLPVQGLPSALDLSDGGSALAATEGSGLALYGFLLSVDISAPTAVKKLAPWTAQAVATARDSPVTSHSWRIEAIQTQTPVLPLTFSGETITTSFDVKGTYRVSVGVMDARGFTANDTMVLAVGAVPPVVTFTAPSGVVKGAPVTIDLNGTRDPDMVPGSANDGIASLLLTPGDGRAPITVDPSTKLLETTFPTAGTFTMRATATDLDGFSASASRSIVVSDDGGVCVPEPCPPPPTGATPLSGLTMARDSGHSLSYGGNPQDTVGRYVLRGPQGTVLYDSQPSGTKFSKTVRIGVMVPDGSAAIVGLSDGTAAHIPLSAPETPFSKKITETAIVFAAVTASGDRVLLGTAAGELVILRSDLREEIARYHLQQQLKAVVADETFTRVVAVDTANIVLLFMGRDLMFGPDDTFTSSMNVRSIAITPNFGANARGNLYLGRDDGRVQIIALVGDRMQSTTPVDMDLRLPVGRLVALPFDANNDWKLAATSEADTDGCTKTSTDRPCGSLMLIDSRGPKVDGVPQLTSSALLEGRAVFLEATPTARHFFVGHAGSPPRIHRYDTLWSEGPVLRMQLGLPATPITAMDMGRSGTSHTLFGTGQLYWLFGPPTALFRVGSHDQGGEPQWGERVTARTNTTFDGTGSLGGDGTVTDWAWDFNGDGVTDSTESAPVFVFGKRGTYNVRLTVVSTLTTPANTTSKLVDRWEQKIAVWNPPPVADLKAKGPDDPTYTTGPITIESGDKVAFDASASSDPDGALHYYRFAFGDGSESSTESPRFDHVYRFPGTYQARVYVADRDGFVDESDVITVFAENRLPTARLYGKQPGRNETEWVYTQNVQVQFFGRTSSDPDGTVQAYEWQLVWDDGATTGTVTGGSEAFTYTFPSLTRDYLLRLRVLDNGGAWSPWTEREVYADDGIRIRQSYNEPDQHYINPTRDVIVTGFVHDFAAYPADGAPVAGVAVHITVWYDGPLGSVFNPQKVEEIIVTTGADGKAVHTVEKNDAGVAYKPGQWRVQMLGEWSPSWDPVARSMTGATEWTEKTETVFIVEPPN